MRILALGDSYTIGEGVPIAEGWPAQLSARLRQRGLEVTEQIIARTGWTAADLHRAILDASTSLFGPFDLVTLLIGVNNQYQGRDLEEYREEFRRLLRMAIALAGNLPGRTLVLSIPDWGVTPFAGGRNRAQIAQEIDAFNGVNRMEAQAAGALYEEITSLSREMGGYPAYLSGDGLHPSGRIYAAWVEKILPVVRTALGI